MNTDEHGSDQTAGEWGKRINAETREAAEKCKGEMGKKVEDGGWKMDGESEGATAFHPLSRRLVPPQPGEGGSPA